MARSKADKVARELGAEPEPWAQQPRETNVAFDAFRAYRDMKPAKRSQARVAKELSKSKPLMGRWSSRWKWVRRARAWDGEQDRRKRMAQLVEVEKMGRRHAQQAQTFGRVLIEPAIALMEKLKDEKTTREFRAALAKMAPDELIALARASAGSYPSLMRAERLARGESTENIEGRVAIETVRAVASRIAARAAKYIPEGRLDAFLADLKADLANEIGGGR